MLTLNDARRIIAAAEKKATEIRQPMNIAVVDEGGNLISHARMDGAWIGSIDISINKAFTSRAFDISTMDLAQHSQSGGQFFGISRFQSRPRHGLCRRHPAETRRNNCWCGRGERWLWRAGSHCGRSRRDGVLTYFIGVNIYGKQSWSCVRRTGKS